MKKRFIMIGVLIPVLAGLYFLAARLNVDKPQEDPAPTSETISIFKTEKDSIAQMTISTAEFSYAFVKGEKAWTVPGKAGIKLNNTRIDNLAYDFASINADVLIEDTGDLSLFGFDNPLGTPRIKLQDGTEQGFVIGSKTPTGTGYYFKLENDDKVYTVYASKCEGFVAPLAHFRDTALPAVDPAALQEIRIQRPDADIHMRAKTEEETAGEEMVLSGWRMTSPYDRDVSSYNLEQYILNKITGFTISKFIDDAPESYAPYGLDRPGFTITFRETDKEPVTFRLGTLKDGAFYLRLNEEPAVYTVLESAFSFRDVNPMNLVDTLAYIQQIDKVDSVTVNSPGEEYVMTITRKGEETEYFIGEKQAYEDTFKKAYQEVIGLLIRGEVTGQPAGEPICTMTFRFNDGRGDDVIEILPYRDRYAAVSVNGKARYYVMREQVAGMVGKIRAFYENPGKQ